MEKILAGAMHLRLATEVLHPWYRLYVPQGMTEGVCLCPGIAVHVITELVPVPPKHEIILQAEVESLK